MLKHIVSIEWPRVQLEINGSNTKEKGENRYWKQPAVSGSSSDIRLRMGEMVIG